MRISFLSEARYLILLYSFFGCWNVAPDARNTAPHIRTGERGRLVSAEGRASRISPGL